LADPEPGRERDPRRKLDDAVVAAAGTRRYRARAFQAFVIASSALFVGIAVLAHASPYFPIDLTVTRALQSIRGPAFDLLMHGISWIGFTPQVDVFIGVVLLAMYFTGLRWEAVSAAFAVCGILLGLLIKLIVFRPRPSADLVHVFRELPSAAFPSGHVLMSTVFIGFLAFLAYTILKSSWARGLLVTAFGILILLMGMSRIYLGQHWFSDVMGAYLLGGLWLALTIRLYRWGKPRFFVRQPVAPAVPAAPSPGSPA
jgi:membrane-associated phospholipid phosphatase